MKYYSLWHRLLEMLKVENTMANEKFTGKLNNNLELLSEHKILFILINRKWYSSYYHINTGINVKLSAKM